MSETEDKELKAGHPPAVKAGGMRIKQSGKHPPEKLQEMTPEEEEEYGSAASSPPKQDIQVMISGVPSRGNKDFPPEAVRAFHNKPVPVHQKTPHPQIHNVQQPRK